MKIIAKLLDFYIYSSIHIALGASLSIILCYALFFHIPDSNYSIFVFCSTVFLYCGHRIVGIKKVVAFQNVGRFAIIKKFRSHLIIYAILGAIGTIYFYLTLERNLQFILLLPGLVSILYILPVFSKHRRLRDFDQIKIFLIAMIWGLIIGLIPYYEVFGKIDGIGWLFFLEKTAFIFGITIPFDIRDYIVDKENKVNTLPHMLSLKNAYSLSYVSLAISIAIVIVMLLLSSYTLKMSFGLIGGYIFAGITVLISRGKSHDYFFGGLIDLSLIIVAVIGIVISGILGVMF